jgi:E3 ubiquitin-protein ligase RNF115/126
MFGGDGKAECIICGENIEVGENMAILPCNRWFPRPCVPSWLQENDNYPMCRKFITQQKEVIQKSR